MALEPQDLSAILRGARNQRHAYLGLNEAVRAMEQGGVELCILANDVNDEAYRSLVEALANETRTALIKVDSRELLGEWAGLARLDEEGNVAKARPCGVVAIKHIPAGPSGEKVKAHIVSNSA